VEGTDQGEVSGPVRPQDVRRTARSKAAAAAVADPARVSATKVRASGARPTP
jgi:hypothetical protein